MAVLAAVDLAVEGPEGTVLGVGLTLAARSKLGLKLVGLRGLTELTVAFQMSLS